MEIPPEEYESTRHVFDLWRWINVKLEEINAEPDADSILLGRKGQTGRMVKRLVEEAIPIACLGLHFCRPLTQVHIKCLAGSQPYDAELQVSGYRSLNLKIEVTTIETNDSALRRLAASQKGFVFSSGPISKEGSKIESTPEMVNLLTQFEQWADLAFDRFVAKVSKADRDTAILICVDTWRALPIESRCSLLRRTKQYLIDKRPHLYGVYFCYGSDYEIDGILTAQALHRAA